MALALGGLTGCGGGDGGSEGSSSGEILLGTIQPLTSAVYSNTRQRDGVEAAVEAINAKGGVNGQKLKLKTCDSAFDANKELSCTRELLDDGVAAIVAPLLMVDQTGRAHALAEKAGVAMIGGRGIVAADLQSSNSFPSTSGQVGWSYGTIAALVNAGSSKISILVDDNPSSQYAASVLQEAVAAASLKTVNVVIVDPAADPTYAASAAKATAGADGLAMAITTNNYPKALQAVRRTGYTGSIAHLSSTLSPENLKASGKDVEGVLLSSHFGAVDDTEDPETARFVDELKKSKPEAVPDETIVAGWAAVQLFAKAMADVEDIDAEKVLDTFTNLSTPIYMGGVMPPYVVQGNTSPLPDFPQMFNHDIKALTVKDGTITSTGDFFDPFETLSGQK
ncbi:ABC transporter substrate-binding protein [Gordonia sp. NPDC058843]|uniref:ABC transporter substrate-binding protein n=1 Tax=Gordonia sp. NPDC058843 TaxID=3346648 RepID=UPI0036AC8D2B